MEETMIPLPISLPDPSLPCYATLVEAAHSALGAAILLGRDSVEAGGALYRHGPLYCFTAPVTQGLPGAVDYRVGLVAPDRMVALYHTHPGSRGALELSPSDEALARRLKLTMYVGAVEARVVVTYCPDTRRTQRDAL
jgi:hypothetical protein